MRRRGAPRPGRRSPGSTSRSSGRLAGYGVYELWAWKVHNDLAAVRDEAALAALPEEERAAWQALWAEVDELIEKHYAPAH